MKIAKDINDIAPFDNDEVLNLVVPLTWSVGADPILTTCADPKLTRGFC